MIRKTRKYTAPYNMMPSSIYVDSEYLHVPESRKPYFRQQVLNGVALGKGHYLRLFLFGWIIGAISAPYFPRAQALAASAFLRNDLASAQLAEHQLEWIVGRNPFSESTMYGEGYDFTPLYTPSSGDMVGALPVGIQSRGDDDAPYWPVQNMWTYKEIWVHPVTNWVWLLKNIAGPSLVEGRADSVVTFTSVIPGQKIVVQPGRFLSGCRRESIT